MLNIVGIRKAVLFIGANFREPLTLTQVANEGGMSKYHFARTFKAITGKTFKEYLSDRRVEEARRLLKEEEVTITEVCYSTGFNDLSYFDRVFRRCEGMSPMAYQRVHREYAPEPCSLSPYPDQFASRPEQSFERRVDMVWVPHSCTVT
jgi:two-component system response regulator YesN